jgi:hypothetical protein
VADHRFRAGQRVTLAANVINRSAVGGSYVVTKRLPERDAPLRDLDEFRTSEWKALCEDFPSTSASRHLGKIAS